MSNFNNFTYAQTFRIDSILTGGQNVITNFNSFEAGYKSHFYESALSETSNGTERIGFAKLAHDRAGGGLLIGD
jgi:hypothetical protein